jgi:V/A-type H+-transporting ATPase subunit E
MKTLEKGQEKIKKICAVLRDETLEPAQKEAQGIIEQAQQQAEQMIADAQKAAQKLHSDAKAAIEQEYRVFQSSLHQAANQGLETIRQSIENKFFNEHLSALIEKQVNEPHLIANLINALVKAVEKEGLSVDLTAFVAKTIPPKQINELLAKEVLNSLQGQSVVVGNFNGGVRLKLQNKKVTLDVSEEALKELLATHIVRKDFRKMIFEGQSPAERTGSKNK